MLPMTVSVFFGQSVAQTNVTMNSSIFKVLHTAFDIFSDYRIKMARIQAPRFVGSWSIQIQPNNRIHDIMIVVDPNGPARPPTESCTRPLVP